LSCEASARIGACYSLNDIIHYFQVPYARIDTYVRSVLSRMDALWYRYETTQDQNIVFIIGPVLVKYAELLQTVMNSIQSEQIRNELFLTPLNLPNLKVTKTGKALIDESLQALDDRYTDPGFILNFINQAISTGQALRQKQQLLPLPNLQTSTELYQSILNVRTLISNINYYETTNRLIEHYRKYIGSYPNDLTDALNEARFLKERYDLKFKETPDALNQVLKSISSPDDALLVMLQIPMK